MTGSIGGRWTARKRLEPSRTNGRGRFFTPSGGTLCSSRYPAAGEPVAGVYCVCFSPRVCAWPRAPWLHPVPSRTWSCPMAAPESTARGTVWEARPLRTLPRGQATDALSYPQHRGVEQWQLVGLITQRSRVRIPPPLPRSAPAPMRRGCCFPRKQPAMRPRHPLVGECECRPSPATRRCRTVSRGHLQLPTHSRPPGG